MASFNSGIGKRMKSVFRKGETSPAEISIVTTTTRDPPDDIPEPEDPNDPARPAAPVPPTTPRLLQKKPKAEVPAVDSVHHQFSSTASGPTSPTHVLPSLPEDKPKASIAGDSPDIPQPRTPSRSPSYRKPPASHASTHEVPQPPSAKGKGRIVDRAQSDDMESCGLPLQRPWTAGQFIDAIIMNGYVSSQAQREAALSHIVDGMTGGRDENKPQIHADPGSSKGKQKASNDNFYRSQLPVPFPPDEPEVNVSTAQLAAPTDTRTLHAREQKPLPPPPSVTIRAPTASPSSSPDEGPRSVGPSPLFLRVASVENSPALTSCDPSPSVIDKTTLLPHSEVGDVGDRLATTEPDESKQDIEPTSNAPPLRDTSSRPREQDPDTQDLGALGLFSFPNYATSSAFVPAIISAASLSPNNAFEFFCRAQVVLEPRVSYGWQRLGYLNQGATGIVSTAINSNLGLVAIKSVGLAGSQFRQGFKSLINELKFYRKLCKEKIDPNESWGNILPPIVGADGGKGCFWRSSDGRVHIATQYCMNGNIGTLKGSCGAKQTDLIVAQVANGIMWLHSRGIIHNDIKPENVLIAPDGRCVIADFGSVKFMKKGQRKCYSYAADRTTQPFTTVFYMAPEILTVLDNGVCEYDEAVDWWALGILAYNMLTGLQLFEFPDHSIAKIQNQILSGPQLDSLTDRVLEKCRKFNIGMDWSSSFIDLILEFLDVNPETRLGRDHRILKAHHHWEITSPQDQFANQQQENGQLSSHWSSLCRIPISPQGGFMSTGLPFISFMPENKSARSLVPTEESLREFESYLAEEKFYDSIPLKDFFW